MPEKSSKTTSESVSSHLEQMIVSDRLAPGTKLPSERQLSARLGVSRAVVREALRQMQGKGIISTHQGQGSYVRCLIGEAESEQAIDQLISLHEHSLFHLLEVREQLEGQAAFLAAKRATPAERYRIKKAFEELSGTDWNADSDYAFHHSILESCHNPVLVHTLTSLKRLTLHSVKASVDHLNHRPEFKAQIDKQHRQIFNAVTGGQADWAKRAAVAHVQFVIKTLAALQQSTQDQYT